MTAVSPSDVQFFLSAPSASAGNAQAGTPGSSFGKYISTTQLSGTALNNLFPDLTGAQNAASQVDYACLFILNATASGNSMLNTVVWLPSSADVAGGATVTIGLDPAAASTKTTSSVQAAVITASTNAPSGVTTWVSNTGTDPSSPSYTNGLQLGTIAPNQCRAIWVKRTATNSSPVNNDGFGLQVDFDSMA